MTRTTPRNLLTLDSTVRRSLSMTKSQFLMVLVYILNKQYRKATKSFFGELVELDFGRC